ncbi:hypothetical protein MRX96_001545 [Rhipicephalus microplus]
MPVVADIDGVQTEIFPIVDEFGVIVFDGDAELYTTTDGKVRVVCAQHHQTMLSRRRRRPLLQLLRFLRVERLSPGRKQTKGLHCTSTFD